MPRTAWYQGKKNNIWKETCQDQGRDGPFFPLPSFSLVLTGGEPVLKGRLGDQVPLEKYRGPPSQVFKKLFLTSALRAPFPSAAV